MADIAPDRLYSKEHEWILVDPTDPALVSIGISDYAQDKLGDIVMVELPEVGERFGQDEAFGAVESPKSVSDVFAPVAGEVVAVNEALDDTPELLNDSPYGDGWIVRLRVDAEADLEALMSAAAYGDFLSGLDAD